MNECEKIVPYIKTALEEENLLLCGSFPSELKKEITAVLKLVCSGNVSEFPLGNGPAYVLKQNSYRGKSYWNFTGVHDIYVKDKRVRSKFNVRHRLTFIENGWGDTGHQFFEKTSKEFGLSSSTYCIYPVVDEETLFPHPGLWLQGGVILCDKPKASKAFDKAVIPRITEIEPLKNADLLTRHAAGVRLHSISSYNKDVGTELWHILKLMPDSEKIQASLFVVNNPEIVGQDMVTLCKQKGIRLVVWAAFDCCADSSFIAGFENLNFRHLIRDGHYCRMISEEGIVLENGLPAISFESDNKQTADSRNQLLESIKEEIRTCAPDSDILKTLKNLYWLVLRSTLYYTHDYLMNKATELDETALCPAGRLQLSEQVKQWLATSQFSYEQPAIRLLLRDHEVATEVMHIRGWMARTDLLALIQNPRIKELRFTLAAREAALVHSSLQNIIAPSYKKVRSIVPLLTTQAASDRMLPPEHMELEIIAERGESPERDKLVFECATHEQTRSMTLYADDFVYLIRYDEQTGEANLFKASAQLSYPGLYLVDFKTPSEGEEEGLAMVSRWKQLLIDQFGSDETACHEELEAIDVEVGLQTVKNWLNPQVKVIAPKCFEHFESILGEYGEEKEAQNARQLWELAERIRNSRRIEGREKVSIARLHLEEQLNDLYTDGEFNCKRIVDEETLTGIAIHKILTITCKDVADD